MRFEIILILFWGGVIAFSESFEGSEGSGNSNVKNLENLTRKSGSGSFNSTRENLSGTEEGRNFTPKDDINSNGSTYQGNGGQRDRFRPDYVSDSSLGGSESFYNTPSEDLNTQQKLFKRPNENKGSSFESSLGNRETFSNRPGQSSNSQMEGNQQQFSGRPSNDRETFSNRPGQSSNSQLGGNQQQFSGRPSNDRETFSNRPGQSSNSQLGGNQQQSSGRPSNDRETFSNRPGQSSNSQLGGNQQQSFGRPSNDRETFSNRPGQSSNSQLGGNQQQFSGRPSNDRETFSNKPGQSSNSQLEGNQSRPSKRPGDSNIYSNGTTGEIASEQDDEKEVCFPVVGCFAMGEPWKSALRPVGKPFSPEQIQTTLYFFSRNNPTSRNTVTVYPKIDMGGAKFDPQKITVIIVHGFVNSGNATWMTEMKDAYLKHVDANVFIVDWGKGSLHINYFQVCGNTRVVGKQLALFVEHLKKNYEADPGKFHLIGHSLGAHICSYLAKSVRGIARLTAMDPAQPAFEGFDARVRLDKSDADFVDVIHTDAKPFVPTLGFGMMGPHGHVDFYINGGFDQPGCLPLPNKEILEIKSLQDLAKYKVEVISKPIACPHGRAYEILTESFKEYNKCTFWGHKADFKNVLKSITNTLSQGLFKKLVALSSQCSKGNCIPLGFETRQSPLKGTFVINTNAKSPFCIPEPGIPSETDLSGKNESNLKTSGKEEERKQTGIQRIKIFRKQNND